jgi:hypothetical protein
MFESFLNPGYLLAGAVLVSLPIIIHLINRMRFKRVRWAAMEFVLKSQKRNRRRLIIEQLLLLALRCLLVLLGVILVSRYLGFTWAMFEPQNTVHVVVLDDSLSMTDQWRQEGDNKDCFATGRELIVKEIANNAVQARTAQRLALLLLSEPATTRFDQRLNDQSIPELQNVLADLKCTSLRLDLSKGIEAAKEIFDKVPQDRRVLHVVSDFRQRDWSEPDATELNRRLDELGRAGVRINLVDTAHPYRSDTQKTPLYHDNLAVVEVKPETRVAAKDMPVQIQVTVANYGVSERKNVHVTVKLNGAERLEASMNLTIPAGGQKSETVPVSFDQLGYNEISANLENEEVGLLGDNTRYAVVQVLRQVPVLVIDGDASNGQKPGGDTYHIQALFTAAKGYQIVPRDVRELEQPVLDQYASIYLLNTREISEKGLRNLEAYVRDGGSVAFFLGDRVNAEFYNQRLYANGKGIFPAPLADRPNPPISEPEFEPNLSEQQPKIIVLNESHPIFAEVWQPRIRGIFNFLPIKRYFPVPRRKWNRQPGQVEELVALPNQRSIRDYAGAVQEILTNLDQLTGDAKLAKYKPALESYQRSIRDLLAADKPLYELATVLDNLLHDRGDPNEAGRAALMELWDQPDHQRSRAQIDAFRQTVRLGDPLVIASQFGKGRVVAFLTTAGRNWCDWAGGSLASPTYPVVMLELQKFLTSGGGETDRIIGTPLAVELDSSRYDAKMRSFYQSEVRDNAGGKTPANQAAGNTPGLILLGEQLGSTASGRVSFVFNGSWKNGPGLYLFELARLGEDGNPGGLSKTEQKAYVFNVDPREGDLRRAARDDLERVSPGAVKLRNLGSGWATELANRQNDLSESPWFYLVFLMILVAEQALAVRLSYHVKGSQSAPVKLASAQETAA